jgi:hypothetical protein
MLSRAPDGPSGAPPLRDSPAIQGQLPVNAGPGSRPTGEGTLRFSFQFTNTTSHTASFPHSVHVVWQRLDGTRQDSRLKGSLRVPGKSSKRYYADFRVDPYKPIVICGYRLDSSKGVHPLRVLR